MTNEPQTQLDLDAKAEIDAATAASADTASTAAESWLKAVAGLTGVLATVAVIKGPTEPAKLPDGVQSLIIICEVVGFVALLAATWSLYAAAYGTPGKLLRIDTKPTAGLAIRRAAKQEKATKRILGATRFGMIAAATGTLAVFAAGLLTLAPKSSDGAADTICIELDGKQLLAIKTDSLAVTRSTEGVAIGDC